MFLRAAILLLIICVAAVHASHHRTLHGRKKLAPEIIKTHSGLYDDGGELYAVLVAGSNGWYNYRHQADVAHAYHILIEHGIPKNNIITMMFDDIAKNKQNPYPGKLYNKPHGEDVYKNITIDYDGDSVTPDNFEAILTGDKAKVKGGNGRVLKSGPNDHVFVYFTDHGATGLIAFPDGIMSVQTLQKTLQTMNSKKKYGKLVFYLEACESGSMFEQLKDDMNIYAITAANAKESSWGTYCENDMKLPCLGDLFSVAWMEDSDTEDLNSETLEKQYELVKARTNKSHVLHFGDLSIAEEPVSDFQGAKKTYVLTGRPLESNSRYNVHWDSRDVELNYLLRQLELTKDENSAEHQKLRQKIGAIKHMRFSVKGLYHEVVEAIFPQNDDATRHLKKAMFRKKRTITQLSCHHDVVHAFDDTCIDFNTYDYAMKYVYVLANLCEEIRDADRIIDVLDEMYTGSRLVDMALNLTQIPTVFLIEGEGSVYVDVYAPDVTPSVR
ncbi:unnamed protein product, partial [Mesorhabditis spiculigera]